MSPGVRISEQSYDEVSLAIFDVRHAPSLCRRFVQRLATLHSPAADCFRGALRRFALVTRLDGVRAGYPSFQRRHWQGRYNDTDRLARHYAGDRGPDNRRDARFRMVVPRVQCERATPAGFYLFRPDRNGYLVHPANDDCAFGRRRLDRVAPTRSSPAAAVKRGAAQG